MQDSAQNKAKWTYGLIIRASIFFNSYENRRLNIIKPRLTNFLYISNRGFIFNKATI